MTFKKVILLIVLGIGVPLVAFKLGGFMAETYEGFSSLPSKDQITLSDQYQSSGLSPFPVSMLKHLAPGQSAWIAVNAICVDQNRHVWIDIDSPIFPAEVGDLYVTRKGSSFIVHIPTDKYESSSYIYRWWPQVLPQPHQYQPVDGMDIMTHEDCLKLRSR